MATRYPYIVSNRDFTTPAKIGDPYPNIGKELSFWQAAVPSYKQSDYNTWRTALLNEITDDRVMFFIHGFDNSWTKVTETSDAKHGLAAMLTHFWSYPGLTSPALLGPIVMFDWPSTGKLPHPYPDAQQKGLQTATQFFSNPKLNIDLKRIIDDIAKAKPGTRINIVCHSMGNYVFAKGAGYLTPSSVALAFVNAAAIDDQSFNPDSKSETLADGIQKCIGLDPGRAALIMNTSQDDALPDAPDPWTELGILNVAPAEAYYPCTEGFDLSEIVNQANQDGAANVHTAYYYIPFVLDLMNFYLNSGFAEADKSAIANNAQVKRIKERVRA